MPTNSALEKYQGFQLFYYHFEFYSTSINQRVAISTF